MAFDDSKTLVQCCNTANGTSMLCYFETVEAGEDGHSTPFQIASLSPASGGFVTWEGEQLTGTFQSGPGIFAPGLLNFTTQITGNAHAQPNNTQVGTAYHAGFQPFPGQTTPPAPFNVFNVYRDNDRVVWTDPKLGAVTAIYYCVWAGTTVETIPDFVPIP